MRKKRIKTLSKCPKFPVLRSYFPFWLFYPVLMENETGVRSPLHSLIPLAEFKALLGLDDREDALSRHCLITATYTIEQYCKRRLLPRKRADYLTFTGPDEFSLDGEFTWPYAVLPYSSARSTFRVHHWAWNMSRYRGQRIGFQTRREEKHLFT
jgi:hypothetical protein